MKTKSKSKPKLWRIQSHIEKAYSEASYLVYCKARALLQAHPTQLQEFIMGMGTWTFVDHDGQYLDNDDPLLAAFRNLVDHKLEYELGIKITGEVMRFTATDPKVTN